MKIDYVRYRADRRQFEIGSRERLDIRGVRRGISPEGYLYAVDDWYPFSVLKLNEFRPDLIFPEADEKARQKLLDLASRRDLINERKNVREHMDLFRLTPYPYQEEVIQRMIACDRLLLTIEQGMGKTFISYMAVWLHKIMGMPHQALVVCPRIVLPNWLYEVRKNTDLTIMAYYGTPEERVELRKKLRNTEWDIIVTTFDSIIERAVAPTDRTYAAVWARMEQSERERYAQLWLDTHCIDEEQRDVLLAAKDSKQCGSIIAGVRPRYLPVQELRALRREDNATLFLQELGFDILLVDEASRCLNTESGRSAAIEQLASTAGKTFLLSGTLCVGRPTDLHEPCNILSKGILGMNNTTFDRTFVVRNQRNVHIVKGYKNLPLLKTLTDPYMVTKTRNGERLQLPERLFETQHCVLPDEAAAVYDDIVLRDEVRINGHTLRTASILQKLNKCQQVCSGFVFTDDEPGASCGDCKELLHCFHRGIQPGDKGCIRADAAQGRMVLELPSDKADALRLFAQLRKEADEKFIVWAWFRPDLARIHRVLEELDIPYVTPLTKDCAAVFNKENTGCMAFVGQERQGIGITLNAARSTMYWSYGMDMEARSQSMDRNYRIGQVEVTTVVDLVTQNTVEEEILRALRHKTNVKTFVQTSLVCAYCEYREDCPADGAGVESPGCLYHEDCNNAQKRHPLRLRTITDYKKNQDVWYKRYGDLGATFEEYTKSLRNQPMPTF